MTNIPTPAKGGMPKWLIIVLVIVLVVMLACCGIFGSCYFFFRTAAHQVSARAPAIADEMRKSIEAEAARQQAEAERRSRGQGNTAAPSETPAPSPSGTLGTGLPSNLPSDIPVYAGLTPQLSQADTAHQGGSVMLSGTGDVKTISAYYEKQMADNGWKQENNTSFGQVVVQTYTKDARQAVVTVTGDGKTTSLSINYAKK